MPILPLPMLLASGFILLTATPQAQGAPANSPSASSPATAGTTDASPSAARTGATAPAPSAPAPPALIRPNPAGDRPVRLTLTDALNLALEENPGVGAVEDRIARARARVREVASAVRPQVSANGNITRQEPVSTVTFPGPDGQPGQTITLGTPTSKTFSFNARQSLDLSGQNRVSRDIARQGITSAELDLARAQNDLLLSVHNAFYGVLRSDQFVTVAVEAVAAAQEQLRVAEVSYREGALARFDVTRAAVQVENLRQNLVTARRNAGFARAQLLNTLGIDPITPVEIVPVELPAPAAAPAFLVPDLPPSPVPESPDLDSEAATPSPAAGPMPTGTDLAAPEVTGPDSAPPASVDSSPSADETLVSPDSVDDTGASGTPMPPPVLPDVDPEITVSSDLPLDLATAVSEAYAIRPEVLNAATAVRISERNVDLARRGRRPDVSLSGQYLFTPDAAGFSANERSWNIGAQLTVPIFEGGLTRARVDQAQADLSAARDTLESVRQAVALEVRTGLLDLQEAARRRQTAAANVVQAREALRIAQVRFRSGVSTTVEVTDAQVAFTQAQTNQVNAEFDFLASEARLRRAVGRLVPAETRTQIQNRPGPPPPPTGGTIAAPARETLNATPSPLPNAPDAPVQEDQK